MNAPFDIGTLSVRLADLAQTDEVARIEGFVAGHDGLLFHRPAWLQAIAAGTGQRALGLIAEKGGSLAGWLPLTEVHSPIFGRALVSSGFAVGGGVLAISDAVAERLCREAEHLAQCLSCPTIELRGGYLPQNWDIRTDSHANFASELAEDDEAQLLTIPRKQRAEVRKGVAADLDVAIGRSAQDRAAHYQVYAESVRNLGTPVFPRSLFDAAMDRIDSDILTIRHRGSPVASVVSFYHGGAVLPYWGGGTWAARGLRANDRMYFELMCHARRRGCTHFDFGRSKTNSGAYKFKKNWGFMPEPLAYGSWAVAGYDKRNVDPTSDEHSARIALWKKLPLPVANAIGPFISRGLG